MALLCLIWVGKRNSSSHSIYFSRHAVARFERTLHPTVNPNRSVFTSEINASFGTRDVRQQRAELPRLIVRASPARPLILVPALRYTAFEVLTHAGVDPLNLFEH